MMKYILTLCSALLFCACNNTGNGAVSKAQIANDTRIDTLAISPGGILKAENDANFLIFAADVGSFEVQAGKLASHKSHNASVKRFADLMIKDHSAVNLEVDSLAAQKSVTLPTGLSNALKNEFAKLDTLTGKNFDIEYANFNVKGHQKVISRFEAVINSTDNYSQALMQLATETLPILKKHLEHADMLQSGLTAKK